MLLFPVSDDVNRPGHYLNAVKVIIIINVCVFLLELIVQGMGWGKELFLAFGFIPAEYYRIWTAVTSTFLHSGFFHLAGNMLFLWIFGDNIEDLLGTKNFILFYIFCGIAASYTDCLFRIGSLVPSIGASGAISGVLGAYIRYFPRNKINTFYFFLFRTGIFKIEAFWYLLFWFIGQLFYSMYGSEAMGIAYGAHIGGFILGFLVIHFFPVDPGSLNFYKKYLDRKGW